MKIEGKKTKDERWKMKADCKDKRCKMRYKRRKMKDKHERWKMKDKNEKWKIKHERWNKFCYR